ncbi:MAG TPA: DUF1615 domain-containing protein [Zeimonas sp.]|nr:DUF1615 domain-containing protein [Zeimonas sp.]
MSSRHAFRVWFAATLVVALAGCAIERRPDEAPASPVEVRARIAALLPENLPDRVGWVADYQAAFAALEIPPNLPNLCAALAITEQESSYRADPSVPNLPKIAREEIDRRATRVGVPAFAVRAALQIGSPDGRTYAERLDAVRTEKELSGIYEDFIGMVPMGRRLFAGWNPVRTGGPMQVGIAFAERHATQRRYPYPMSGTVRDEVFTRRGGLYFGIAHLLDYPASYDRHLYRFADFNAGRYASRNAAFQNAVAVASGVRLGLDGDLIRHGGSAAEPGSTERAVRTLGKRLGLDDTAIRRALEQGESAEFERDALYRRVFELADAAAGRPLPRAVVPRIALQGPKITRKLTTEWFANRVDERHRRCIARGEATALRS